MNGHSSDADSDVLADYVLALLRHDQVDDEVKKLCIEQLDDFLRERNFSLPLPSILCRVFCSED